MAKRREREPDDATIARLTALEREVAHLRQIIRDVRSLRSIDGGSRASHLLRVAIEDICKQPIEGGRK